MPETLGRLALVATQLPTVGAKRYGVGLAVHVPREVLGGPAQLEQHLLDVTTLAGVHRDGVRVDARAHQWRNFL